MLGHPNFLKWFCKCWSFVRQINCPLPRLLIGSLLQRLQLRSWAMVGIVNHYFYYSCIHHSVFAITTAQWTLTSPHIILNYWPHLALGLFARNRVLLTFLASLLRPFLFSCALSSHSWQAETRIQWIVPGFGFVLLGARNKLLS